LLIKNGNYLTDKRGEYLNLLHLEYDKSEISENRLKQYDQEEIAAGSTLVGPHRDDFVFMVQDPKLGGLGLVDVSRFGSRGEQRMAVWNLKLGEIDYLGANPILLLDDIFSELDKKHRETVVEMVKHYPGQVVMTTADIDQAPTGEEWNIIKL
jgi:DNA replication and repair protein RecF